MSALRQPGFSTEYYAPQPKSKEWELEQKNKISQPLINKTKIVKSRDFSQSQNLPNNLKILSVAQQASFCLALVSMATSIGVYISTVQIPDFWSQEYQNLEDLQRQERQLVSINETMKYQIAKEAVKSNSLSISKPESAIFINPALVKPRAESKNNQHNQELINLKYESLGY